jgi:hypothetical protein
MPATIETYPNFAEQVRQHRGSNKKRLRLAVYLAPPRRAKGDVFIFEVIDGFGGNVDTAANGRLPAQMQTIAALPGENRWVLLLRAPSALHWDHPSTALLSLTFNFRQRFRAKVPAFPQFRGIHPPINSAHG